MAVPLSVRKATPDDMLGVFKLAVSMHTETDFKKYQLNPEKTFSNLGIWIGQPNAAMLIATRGDDIVGMLACSIAQQWYSDETLASEQLFFVRSDQRGTRAAYILLKAYFQWAIESKADHVMAGVSTGTGEAAERLYAKFGMYATGGNYIKHIKE